MIKKIFQLGLIQVLLVSCTVGIKFAIPASGLLILKKTTLSQVITSFGKPYSQSDETINGIPVKGILYCFGDTYPNYSPLFAGTIPIRYLHCYFLNDTLVQFNFISNFLEKHTYFTPDKYEALKEGMSKQEVVGIMGTPTGEQTYPFDVAYFYHYSQTWKLSKQTESRKLTLFFNADNTIKKIEYQNNIGY